jgi:hypothetical protein
MRWGFREIFKSMRDELADEEFYDLMSPSTVKVIKLVLCTRGHVLHITQIQNAYRNLMGKHL